MAAIAAAGTHPFSSWVDQEITPLERYLGVKKDMQDLAQQLLIFGTHVHIGIEDRDFLVDAMNVARYLPAPHPVLVRLLPVLMGCNTGLKSYRSIIIFRRFPPGILPEFASWATSPFRRHARQNHSIPDGSKLWWDVRPNCCHPDAGVSCLRCVHCVDEAVCIAAIFQRSFRSWGNQCRDTDLPAIPLIEENKWRAVRYGLDGQLLDLGKQTDLPARELIWN